MVSRAWLTAPWGISLSPQFFGVEIQSPLSDGQLRPSVRDNSNVMATPPVGFFPKPVEDYNASTRANDEGESPAQKLQRMLNNTSTAALHFWTTSVFKSALDLGVIARQSDVTDHAVRAAPGHPSASSELNRQANTTLLLSRLATRA
jgi:hypothetical protein